MAPYVCTMHQCCMGPRLLVGSCRCGVTDTWGVCPSCGAMASPLPHGQGLQLGLWTSPVPQSCCHREGGREVLGPTPTGVRWGLPTIAASLGPTVGLSGPLCNGRACAGQHMMGSLCSRGPGGSTRLQQQPPGLELLHCRTYHARGWQWPLGPGATCSSCCCISLGWASHALSPASGLD